jgi:hypothetical protein
LACSGGGDDTSPTTTAGPTTTAAAATTVPAQASREAREAVLVCIAVAERWQWGAADGVGAAEIIEACNLAVAELEVDGTPLADRAQVSVVAMINAVRQSAVTAPDPAAMAALVADARAAVGI